MPEPPDIRGEAGIYVAVWKDLEITARFERFSEARDTVTAEVTIQATSPQANLFWGRINLLSSRSRLDAVRQLVDRYDPQAWKWADVLDAGCLRIMEMYRKGEPVIHIGNLPAQGKEEYRIWPFVKEGQANLVYGPGGTGKTNLACFLALLAKTGRSHAGVNAYPDPVNPLIMDYESDQDDLNDRIRDLRAGMGISGNVEMAYRRCFQPLSSEIEEVRRHVIEQNIGFVIVDSLGTACGGTPEAADSILQYFAALRSLRVSTLTISHTNKENKLFGSVYTWNQSRNTFEVKGGQEEGSDEMALGLYHVKINRGKRLKPFALKFKFGEEGVKVENADLLNVMALEDSAPPPMRIIGLLRHGRLSSKDIAESLNIPEGSVRTYLTRELRGQVQSRKVEGQQVWELPRKGSEEGQDGI